MSVKRILVEKKENFKVESKHLFNELNETFKLNGKLTDVRVINCYDLENISDEAFDKSIYQIFAQKNEENITLESINIPKEAMSFRVELLPGQFDQRGDSASQCIELITLEKKPIVKASKIYILQGDLDESTQKAIKNYLINPVESQEVSLQKPHHLSPQVKQPQKVRRMEGFNELIINDLQELKKDEGLAMSVADLLHCQKYFQSIGRVPTITEMKVLDTYWSDHCRHTTFLTTIDSVDFGHEALDQEVESTFNDYLAYRQHVYPKKRPVNLMDLATINTKYLKKENKLPNLDISEEINACSIKAKVKVKDQLEDYLVMFKNETHNHPTEIEPYGGAATCLGGAIRDPLSGRAYVYQAMRVTGSGDPRQSIDQTLQGKLPQKQITQGAAKGYSSYGNQIGLATGFVKEYYNESFLAKRMEIGAVIAAAPAKNVVRHRPEVGDVILLVGGKTGRDGCGGATGSSKVHHVESIKESSAEVQKGNPPEERKIQRLFRNAELSPLIKRCNDFGAGGVSVAIGELADSIDVDLDKVPKKYDGLDGTELAISESQERMAVVVHPDDVQKFKQLAHEENVEATVVAKVTDSGKFRMYWQGDEILSLDRFFLETNGVLQHSSVKVNHPYQQPYFTNKSYENFDQAYKHQLASLNSCSQKGLVEMFDSTIGSNTVLMPFGGKYQLTPTQGMVAKVPVLDNDTSTVTVMTSGYDPELAIKSPYHGGMYAILSSVAKQVALGSSYNDVWLTLQEYFEKLNNEPRKWAKPFSALLGALKVQSAFEIAAIGGKDSMSGTFKDIHVPPTLVSFAVSVSDLEHVVPQHIVQEDSVLILADVKRDSLDIPDFNDLKNKYAKINSLMKKGIIKSAYAVEDDGWLMAVTKMAFGNKIGFNVKHTNDYFKPNHGAIVLEMSNNHLSEIEFDYTVLGETTKDSVITAGNDQYKLDDLINQWEEPLNRVFPIKSDIAGEIETITYRRSQVIKAPKVIESPKVVIPVFPGTNCEWDTYDAFKKAGADPKIVVFNNMTPTDIKHSIDTLEKEINDSHIIALPGGFSAGDEPAGSGKFIASIFRNPKIKQATMHLLNNKKGLMIGICNGFQALVKLGLLPYGDIRELDELSPTLTHNKIGRHISKISRVRVASNVSPWLKHTAVGDVYQTPVSHGEGCFFAKEDMLKELIANGQVATQYVDMDNKATYDGEYNPNGSVYAIEGITSKDGRIFGKMGHVERDSQGLYKNIIGKRDMKLFQSAVEYFKGGF